MADLEKAGVQLVAEGAGAFFGDMNKAAGAVNDFSSATGSAAGKIDGSSQVMIGALREVGRIAVSAFLEAGKAVVGFVSDSINVAGDFEAGMNRFAAVAGGALDESGLSLKDFRDQFIQIGKELPVSTSEVQEAALQMVKGGIDPATVAAGGLRQVIQFAAAADLDLAQSAEIAAKALGGWVDQAASADEKAAFLTKSTDLMAKAANASTVDVDDLALGLYNVQGTAKLAGLSFDETVTTLAELAPSFSSSADAGTSFKTFLARLQPTTQPATAAMKELGLYTEETGSIFYDAQGNFIGMEQASAVLQAATANLTDAQKAQYLQTIFGQDAIRTAAVLSEQGATGYNNMTAALANQNSVAEMAAQKQAGFNTALDNAKGSFEALQITVGSVLLPILTDLLNNVIAPGVNFLTDFAGALSGDADAFGRLSETGQYLVGVVQQLWTDLQTGIGVVQGIAQSFSAAGSESSTLGGMLDDLSGIWNNLLGMVGEVAAGYEQIVKAVLPIVQGFIRDHGDEISAFFQTAWDTIMDIITTAIDLYRAIVPPVLAAIAQFISAHGTEITQIITGLWNGITAIIDGALALIKGILTVALKLIQGDWQGAWDEVKATASRVWDDIKQLIGGVLDIIVGLFGGAWKDIRSAAETAWGGFKGWFDGMLAGLVGAIEALPGQVAGVGAAIVNSIWDGVRAQWDAFIGWLNGKLQEVSDLLPGSEPKDVNSPLRGLKERGRAIVEMIQAGMDSSGPLDISGIVQPAADTKARGLLADTHAIGMEAGSALVDGFTTGAGGITAVGDTIARALSDGVKDGTAAGLEEAGTFADRLADTLKDALRGLKDSIGGIFEGGPSGGGGADLGGFLGPQPQSQSRVAPPASAAQMATSGASRSATYNNQRTYNYAPTYATQPKAPSTDFAIMQALAT